MRTETLRWEFRVLPWLALLGVIVLALLPLSISLLGALPLSENIRLLGKLSESHRFRELTGYGALALVAFEGLLILHKRGKLPFMPGNRISWRSAHIFVGASLIPLVVIHTGGRWGSNLNGALLLSLMAVVLIGVAGKLIEAIHLQRNVQSAKAEAGKEGGRRRAPMHTYWLRLHMMLATVLVALLGFHIFSVYYF